MAGVKTFLGMTFVILSLIYVGTVDIENTQSTYKKGDHIVTAFRW